MARRKGRKATAAEVDTELPQTVEEIGRTEHGERIVALPLKVKLDPEAQIAKGRELTAALAEVERIAGEKAKSNSEHNRMLKDIRKTVSKLADAFNNGVEERPVSCREELDYARGIVRLVRIEDEHVVETRTMTPAERQMEIPEGAAVVHSAGDGAEARA